MTKAAEPNRDGVLGRTANPAGSAAAVQPLDAETRRLLRREIDCRRRAFRPPQPSREARPPGERRERAAQYQLVWPLLVTRIRVIRLAMSYWDALLHKAVAEARRGGVSWTDIARALGVSRQAASQRFSDSHRGAYTNEAEKFKP